ncbi:MAG: hypothetical protein QG616_882 [Pseudomonadota bacterium]|nr:hypothetical protein [Pseudomonadota bacterium]MDQ5881052.1 hypothetical protein [Pseudomonadota bacterium]MDQ5917674.1 hypothetical protein [Pseudomonadota bacterium]
MDYSSLMRTVLSVSALGRGTPLSVANHVLSFVTPLVSGVSILAVHALSTTTPFAAIAARCEEKLPWALKTTAR